MKEEFLFLSNLYPRIYNWLTTKTPGERTYISYIKEYDENVWKKIRDKIDEISKKDVLSNIEKDFLKCKYVGNAYRIINYNSKKRGHVYAHGFCQSCSKKIDSLKKMNIFNPILIEIEVTNNLYGIDVFELLTFMWQNNLISIEDNKKYNCSRLISYEFEEEVIVPIFEKNIMNVSVANFRENTYENLPRNKWFRKNLK